MTRSTSKKILLQFHADETRTSLNIGDTMFTHPVSRYGGEWEGAGDSEHVLNISLCFF